MLSRLCLCFSCCVFKSYRPLSRNPATTASRTRASVMATATIQAWARSLVAVTVEETKGGVGQNHTWNLLLKQSPKVGGSPMHVELYSTVMIPVFHSLSGVLTVRAGLEFKTSAKCAVACWGPGSHLQCITSKYITSTLNTTSYSHGCAFAISSYRHTFYIVLSRHYYLLMPFWIYLNTCPTWKM